MVGAAEFRTETLSGRSGRGQQHGPLLLREGEWGLISEEAEKIFKILEVCGEFNLSLDDYPTPPKVIFCQILF